MRWFSSSIDLVAWPVEREDSHEKFQKKDLTKLRKSQTVTWGLGNNTLPSIFPSVVNLTLAKKPALKQK